MEEAPPLPTLQPEILLHIFHKLPIRSVSTCKLVSKEWCSLISDPFFKSNYNPSSIPNHPLNLMLIPSPCRFHKKTDTAMRYEIDGSGVPLGGRPQPLPSTYTSQDRIAVLGSWNGLVALYQHPGDFRLFNPCTGEETVVHTDIRGDDKRLWESCNLYGLCYDSVNDEYKAVLCVSTYFGTPRFYVVSFRDGKWKLKTQNELQHFQSYQVYGPNMVGTVVNGVPHWICRTAMQEYDTSIYYFDSEKEEFRMAPRVPYGREVRGLGALDGQLTAALATDGGVEIWALKEDGNGQYCWSMLFFIVNQLSSSVFSWIIKEVEVLIDVSGIGLCVYNIRDRRLRLVQWSIMRSSYSLVVYTPRLISPTQ